jgi:uncharacterized protein YukE
VQARLSRLMLATQQVRKKYDMKVLNKGGGQGGLTCSKQWLQLYQKLLDIYAKLQRLKQDLDHTAKSIAED